MTAHDREDDPDAVAEIVRLVHLCQAQWGAWASVDEPSQQQLLRGVYQGSLEQLWGVLEPHLRRVAYHWMRSNIAPDVESLTLNMFTYVMEALPRMQLDPTKNPISYLTTVAWRGCYDEYGRYYDVRRVRRRTTDVAGEASDTLTEGANNEIRFNEELPVQLADSRSDLADEVIDQVDDTMVLRVVRRYWQTLPIDTQKIMEWRSFVDPPRSFKEIAPALGPGWTEAAARKRYSRTIDATRAYLRTHGLLDSPV